MGRTDQTINSAHCPLGFDPPFLPSFVARAVEAYSDPLHKMQWPRKKSIQLLHMHSSYSPNTSRGSPGEYNTTAQSALHFLLTVTGQLF